jgi:eukaryotic-like serine/threonine-protein kinase
MTPTSMTPPRGEATVGRARDGAAPLPLRYRVVRRLASGGMGTVWAAEDQLLRRQVAVKVLADNLAGEKRFVRRFEREARTAARLTGHPNIVTIHDVGEHDGRPFIVMEYLSGGTLADRLHGPLPEPQEALRWLRHAALALDYAHERGVVHRDVKPANLLFDERGWLAITDFGIARAAFEQTLTGSGELFGTAAYISPEQAQGEPGWPASDRYSLAVIAYELLTGQRPFDEDDFVQQAIAHIQAEPRPASELWRELPSEVDAVLARGLAKEPTKRWQSAIAFVEALETALEGMVVSDSDPSDGDPFEEPHRMHRRRHVLPVALLVGAAIATGTIFAFAVTGNGDQNKSGRGNQQSRAQQLNRGPSGREPQSRARKPRSRTRDRPSTTTPTNTTGAKTAIPVGAPAQLNDEGFRLMRAGRYAEAIPLLERAVGAFPEDSNELTYAYALYNLGRSLRLAGRAQEAIPLLERRLRIPNQRDAVARELSAARLSAGQGEPD